MIIGEGSLKDMARVIIWFFLRYLILIMPPPSEFALTRFLGSCFYHLSRTKRMVVRENLESVLGDRPSMDGLIKQTFQNHFVDQYLIFSFPKMSVKNMGRYVSVEGLRHLDDALARGKGVIIIHGHVGLRLLPLFGLAVMGYRMYQIEGPVARGLSLLGRYCARQKTVLEKRIPANIIGGERFLRPIFEALSRNEIVMIAGDGTGGGRFMGRQLAVRFMGHRLKFPAGPVLLASKTGATLVPLFTLEGEGGAPYRAVIHPSWMIAETRLGKRELVAQVERFVRLLESVIREHPHLWHFWDEFYERTAASDAGDESRP